MGGAAPRSDLAERKATARADAFARRKLAHAQRPQAAAGPLIAALAPHLGRPLAGYMPMRTEIDPLPAMGRAAATGLVGVPVIEGRGLALRFALWVPGAAMVRGPFGADVPETLDWMVPEVLIVPLVAFTRAGGRLGYGGGFYDRTLEGLRARGPVLAIGFAFAAQEAAALPLEPVDQPLDMIVTETEVIVP